MPNVKISAASDAGTLLATDMLPLARSGDTNAYHATMAEVGTYIGASPGNVFANQVTFQAGLLLNNNQYIDWKDNAGTAQPVIALDNSNNLVLRTHGSGTYIESGGGTVVASVDSSGNVSANGNVSASGNISTAGGSVSGAYLSSSGNVNAGATVTCAGLNDSGGATIGNSTSVGGWGITYPGVGGGSNYFAYTYDASSQHYSLFLNGGLNATIVCSRGSSGLTSILEMDLEGASNLMVAYYSPSSYVQWTITFSDRRLKSNLRPADANALAVVNQIGVYDCDVASPLPDGQSEHWDCALVADEVAKLIPNAFVAAPERDGRQGYESLRELPLIAILWRAVQQLSAEVATLKAR